MKDALGETDMTSGVQLRMGPTGGWEGSQTGGAWAPCSWLLGLGRS